MALLSLTPLLACYSIPQPTFRPDLVAVIGDDGGVTLQAPGR